MASNDPHHGDGRRILGGCHCGNIRLHIDWPGPAGLVAVRACGCSFCTKHGGLWTSNPKGSFRVTSTDPAQVHLYRFGTRTADFHVCTNCGTVPIVTCELDGKRYAVVNANTFENVPRAEFQIAATDFEGETTEDRLSRRRRNWMPEAASAAPAGRDAAT